jgi:hypothetical protein
VTEPSGNHARTAATPDNSCSFVIAAFPIDVAARATRHRLELQHLTRSHAYGADPDITITPREFDAAIDVPCADAVVVSDDEDDVPEANLGGDAKANLDGVIVARIRRSCVRTGDRTMRAHPCVAPKRRHTDARCGDARR